MTRERLPHAYLVESPDSSASARQAAQIAAAVLCEAAGDRPCGSCRHCRKVFAGIHPDVTRIGLPEGKGKPRREITVDQIRGIITDAAVAPNEAGGKVYIIEDAELMNANAQNALLKVLEEPPNNICFVLCARLPKRLLETVRSRCVSLRIAGEDAAPAAEYRDFAAQYLRLLEGGDAPGLLRFCVLRESLDTANLTELFRALEKLCLDALCHRYETTISRPKLLRLLNLCGQSLDYLAANVGAKHVLGVLSAITID